MGNESFDVVIVGGGMGGLNLAALLTHEGKRVSVDVTLANQDGAARMRKPRSASDYDRCIKLFAEFISPTGVFECLLSI